MTICVMQQTVLLTTIKNNIIFTLVLLASGKDVLKNRNIKVQINKITKKSVRTIKKNKKKLCTSTKHQQCAKIKWELN